jgi:two-component system, LytTR family, response regulator LytT
MSDQRLTVLVVDDEQPQLEDLARLVGRNPRVSEVQTATTARDALVMIAQGSYDVIFLDVRMPDLDGLELAKVLTAGPQAPALVFVSAFDASAVAAFELRAIDYLMKPVGSARIDEALSRVEAGVTPSAEIAQGLQACQRASRQEIVLVRDLRSHAMRLLTRASILYVKACGDYIRLHADSGRYLLRSSLSDVEERLGDQGFLRVHRQYLANLARAVELQGRANGTAVMRFENGDEIPVSRRQVPVLRRRVHG